jgi:hypothetical protein
MGKQYNRVLWCLLGGLRNVSAEHSGGSSSYCYSGEGTPEGCLVRWRWKKLQSAEKPSIKVIDSRSQVRTFRETFTLRWKTWKPFGVLCITGTCSYTHPLRCSIALTPSNAFIIDAVHTFLVIGSLCMEHLNACERCDGAQIGRELKLRFFDS